MQHTWFRPALVAGTLAAGLVAAHASDPIYGPNNQAYPTFVQVDPTTGKPVAPSASGTIGQGAPGTSPWPVTESAGSLATNQVTATTTSAQLCAARAGRRAVTLENLGTTPVFYGATGVTATTGALLVGSAGSTMTLNTAAAIFGLTASGTSTIACIETY